MTSTTPPAVRPEAQPTPAQRARTVACQPPAAVCATGVSSSRVLAHTTTRAGDVLLVVAAGGDLASALAADGDLPALVMITDRAPVPLREPVRAQLWLSGWLNQLGAADQRAATLAFAEVLPAGALLDVGRTATLLRLDLAEVVLAENGRSWEIDPEDYAAAAPDPLAALEADALQHLDEDHPEQLAVLSSQVPPGWLPDGAVVRPLRLDRTGFWLRIETGRGQRDVPVPFDVPLTTAEELGSAVHRLMCRARHCCQR